MTDQCLQITEDEDQEYSHVFSMLKQIIDQSYECRNDQVSQALHYFLARVSNTWLSVCTLRKYSLDQKIFMVDAGVLLRAMLDACFQAEYMLSDHDKAVERASDYLDFEYVDRFKLVERIFRYNNELTRKMKQSPKRAEGEKKLESEYKLIKHRYPKGKTTKAKTKVRDKWYTGQLRDIVDERNIEEYDCVLSVFQGCVHSSALAVRQGPPHFLKVYHPLGIDHCITGPVRIFVSEASGMLFAK